MKQPKPRKNNQKFVVDEVIKDLKKRKKEGKRKYGTYLQPFNGRDALQDLLEELYDASVYLKQFMMEQKKK